MPELSALRMMRVKAYLRALARYAGIQVLLGAALLVMLALAAGFGIAAATIWLSAQLGAVAAFGVIAGGLLMAALLLQVVLVVHRHRSPRYFSLFTGTERPDQGIYGMMAAVAVVGYLLGRRAH